MSDPLSRRGSDPLAGTLFEQLGPARARSTQEEAHAAAMRDADRRIEQILGLLRERGPMTCFELSRALGTTDNRISGRLTDLKADGTIEPTGDRRINPETGRKAEVYRLSREASVV